MFSFNPDDYTSEELKDLFRKDEKYLMNRVREAKKEIKVLEGRIEADEKELKFVKENLKELHS